MTHDESSMADSPTHPATCPVCTAPGGSASNIVFRARGIADLVGVSLAGACGLHCVAMPLLLAAAPVLAGGWLASESAEWTLLVAGIIVGLPSIGLGTLGFHRCRRPLVLFLGGMGAVLLARMKLPEGSLASIALVGLGASLVVAAHLRNRVLFRAAR